MDITIVVTVEAKDEFLGPNDNWYAGKLPDPLAATAVINDILASETKHDETISWRVIKVEASSE